MKYELRTSGTSIPEEDFVINIYQPAIGGISVEVRAGVSKTSLYYERSRVLAMLKRAVEILEKEPTETPTERF